MANSNVYKWSFIDRVGIAIINFGVNITLVRMLTTADFGLLAMIAIFIAVASDLSSCGLSDGLIYKTKPTELDYSTVFMFNVGMGVLFGAFFFFGAPWIASFFGHQELVLIMRVLGVSFIFQAMGYVQETRLRKQLQMKTICMVHLGGTITASACAIIAAACGWGYKSLIFTQILLYSFYFVYFTLATRWFPRIAFSVKAFKEFFSYGVHLMLAFLATLIGRNINTFVMGRFYPSPSLSGIYYQGAKLAVVPFAITEGSLNNPFFPVVSNEENADRRRELLRNMYSTLLFVNATFLILLLVFASPIIICIFGDKWAGAVPVLRILGIAEFLVAMRAYFQTVCKVHGRTSVVKNLGFIEVALQLGLLWIFYLDGIIAIAWTQTMGVAFTSLVYIILTHRHFKLSLYEYLGLLFQSLWLPVVAGAAALIVLICYPAANTTWPGFIASILVFLITFVCLGQIFKPLPYKGLRQRILHK